MTHPSERFTSLSSISPGVPLKSLFNKRAVELIADSMEEVAPGFDRTRFRRAANRGLEELELMERAARIGEALSGELPSDFSRLVPVLIASMGAPLSQTEGNGLRPFFYLPHSYVIGSRGPENFEAGMLACRELTRRFTAEFCVRPILASDPDRTLQVLSEWTTDSDPHVRRLVSEGTRSRLPWGMRLRWVQQNPERTVPLLEALKDDESEYVRRSVANHLGDMLKDSRELGLEICESWLERWLQSDLDRETLSRQLWVVRHALRWPAKQGDPVACRLRERAGYRTRGSDGVD